MGRRRVEWGMHPSTDKVRLVRERGGSRIQLLIDVPWTGFILDEQTQLDACYRFQEAVNARRVALQFRAALPTIYEGKIIWDQLEIDVPRIKSEGKARQAAVRRRVRTALDAIQEYLDSTKTANGGGEGQPLAA